MSLKIASGALKGRPLKTPPDSITRPTSERLRMALFNMLSSQVEEGCFIDLCSGSGAMGLEALSRGAPHAVFVERHPQALDAIRHNIKLLGMEKQATLIHADVFAFAKWQHAMTMQIAAIYFDPPYERLMGEHAPIIDLFIQLDKSPFCTEKTQLFWEHSRHYPLSLEEKERLTTESSWSAPTTRNYGDALLELLQR